MSDTERAMAALGGIVAAMIALVALIAFVVVYQGFVLSWLWKWFVVPLGVPELHLAWACGLIAVWHLVNGLNSDSPYAAIKMIDPYKIIMTIGADNLSGQKLQLLKQHSDRLTKEVSDKHAEKLMASLAKPIIILIAGWFISLFM